MTWNDRWETKLFLGGQGTCLLYTSDAADEEDSVDLGGRRIIKKKTTTTSCSKSGETSNSVEKTELD